MRTVLSLLILLAHNIYGQDCSYTIDGKIIDTGTKHSLEYANIYVEELEKGTLADSNGYFELKKLCKGSYHLRVSHISCETVNLYLNVESDTTINISLAHHSEFLNEVVVHGKEEDQSTELSKSITSNYISQQSGKILSEILENISGVSTIKSGSGISKPVINGLYGNRISIINNGLAQAGQRWGDDHAPEVDPNIADHISVVKGVGSLQYGSNLGSIVIIEPGNIPKDNHIHGRVNYNYQTNGRGHSAHVKLEKSLSWIDWRVTASAKRIGDRRAPDYFLTNTGSKENNIALQLDKSLSKSWSIGSYYSLFTSEIGVLAGSHVSTESDKEAAFDREVPFSTSEVFSYNTEAPRQKVTHHLWKLEAKYAIDQKKFLALKYGGQLNKRREFDRRRSNRSAIPAMSLNLTSHFIEGIYTYSQNEEDIFKIGVQYHQQKNATQPGTGVLPFIPDYSSYNPSIFASYKKGLNEKLFFESGARYEFKKINVAAISGDLPRRIERFNHSFHNYSITSGIKFDINTDLVSNINAGYVLRSPEINELYSRGLHQGSSRIEDGNQNLHQEKSLKIIWTNTWFYNDLIYIEISGYHQHINDYIYLKPKVGRIRDTIRGVFDIYQYEQTDANISGIDLIVKFEPGKHVEWTNKLSFIRGQDTSVDSVLVNIPSNNLNSELAFVLSDWKSIKGTKLSINGKYVIQNRILAVQDVAPIIPDSYFLTGITAHTNLHLKDAILGFSFQVENLFNTNYREYLNQLRFFADDVGRNISFNLKYSF